MPPASRRPIGLGWLVSLAFSTSLGVIIFASTLLLQTGESPVAPPPPVTKPRANWAAEFPASIDRVTEALQRLPLALPTPREEPQGSGALRWTHRRYQLTMPAPEEPGVTEKLLDPVRGAAPGVTMNVVEEAGGTEVRIGIDGLLTHTLAFHWLGRRPRAAIVIDDLGNDLRVARELTEIDAPLAFAVMPQRPFSREVAELAALFKREVLVHLPMEAENGEDFGAETVLQLSDRPEDVQRALDAFLPTVPHAVGANNHMGSRFTSDREHMRWVLEDLKDKGLFFIDSRTSPHSVACDVAARIPVPCAARSVFLDDSDEEDAIRTAVATVVTLARTRGDVIAIGHPRPNTLAVLRDALPSFADAGIELVPVSTIVAEQSLSHR